MSGDERFVLWGGLGVAIVGVIIAYLNFVRKPQVNSSPQGFTLSLAPGTFLGTSQMQPAQAITPSANTTGSSYQPSPGTTAVFNIPPPQLVTPVNPWTGSQTPSSGCGCGSADGTSACNAPGATTQAFGSPADAAAALFAGLGPAMHEAIAARNLIGMETAWGLSTDTGGSYIDATDWALGGAPAQQLFNKLAYGAG